MHVKRVIENVNIVICPGLGNNEALRAWNFQTDQVGVVIVCCGRGRVPKTPTKCEDLNHTYSSIKNPDK